MKHVVTVLSLLLATPAFSADVDRLRLPGFVTEIPHLIDPRPDPNSLAATQPLDRALTLESQDGPSGQSLSPKLNPPGLEFKRSF
jgi:hypothetical protein